MLPLILNGHLILVAATSGLEKAEKHLCTAVDDALYRVYETRFDVYGVWLGCAEQFRVPTCFLFGAAAATGSFGGSVRRTFFAAAWLIEKTTPATR